MPTPSDEPYTPCTTTAISYTNLYGRGHPFKIILCEEHRRVTKFAKTVTPYRPPHANLEEGRAAEATQRCSHPEDPRRRRREEPEAKRSPHASTPGGNGGAIQSTGSSRLDPIDWIQSTGSSRLVQNEWIQLTGSGGLDPNDWIQSTGSSRLDPVDWTQSTGMKPPDLENRSSADLPD